MSRPAASYVIYAGLMAFFTPELFVNVDWIFIVIYKNFSWKYSNMKFLGSVLIKVKVLSVDPTTNLNRVTILSKSY